MHNNLDASIRLRNSDNISIEYDDEYTKKLEEIRGESVDDSVNCYTTYEILLPRKHHMSVV